MLGFQLTHNLWDISKKRYATSILFCHFDKKIFQKNSIGKSTKSEEVVFRSEEFWESGKLSSIFSFGQSVEWSFLSTHLVSQPIFMRTHSVWVFISLPLECLRICNFASRLKERKIPLWCSQLNYLKRIVEVSQTIKREWSKKKLMWIFAFGIFNSPLVSD